MKNPSIDTLIMTEMDNTILAVARAALRYEALRRLTPKQFSALHDTALTGQRTFDSLVDQLVIDMHTDKFKDEFANVFPSFPKLISTNEQHSRK